MIKAKHREEILRYVVLAFASLVMAVDYRTFVEWGGLYPGGAAGLAMLVQRGRGAEDHFRKIAAADGLSHGLTSSLDQSSIMESMNTSTCRTGMLVAEEIL